MIRWNLLPGKTVTWDEFCAYPRYSIALDGFCSDSTRRDVSGPYANFDHHNRCDRLATRSTAEQVHLEINLGLFETFQVDGRPRAEIWINDCDEDTALSVWLLANHERVRGHAEPLINRLVYCNDRMDATAGIYPFGDVEQLRRMAWIFEFYHSARVSGLQKLSASTMKSVFAATLGRIDLYAAGKSEELKVDRGFKFLQFQPTYSVIEETSTTARMFLFASGVSAFLSVLPDNRYVIGKKSMWVPGFPLEKIYAALNKAEPHARPGNLWGGSNTIGGSPRETGSGLTLEQIVEIINQASALATLTGEPKAGVHPHR